MADVTDIERLNYYEGEYLGAVDFEAEQEYHRDMRRRHSIGPHTWGIVTGLDIAQFLNGGPNNEVDILIQPGVAVDGFGREIVVFSPYQLTAEMFADFPARQTLSVWIGYWQQMLNADSDTCASSGQTNSYSRVQESFQIVIQPFPPTSDPVYVGGNAVTPPSASNWTQPATLPPLPSTEGAVVIALDDSVPFQELPDDNTTANWLVQLGQVLWDGVNQVFVQSADGTANQNRQYVGSVAATIYAPAGILTIQDRSTLSSAVAGGGAPTGLATITAYNASGGAVILTVSPALANAYTAGQIVIFSGFSSGLAGLNGRGFSVLSSPSPGTSQFAISAPSVSGAGNDTGTATPQPLGVAVEVQGTLTVDEQLTAQQDIWLNGGNAFALRFKDSGGTDNGTALNLQRLDGSSGGADLHVHIGDGSNPTTTPQRLTVGYGTSTANQDTNAFIVGCDGNVQIPQGSLSFGTQQAQILNLSGSNYAIGVQTNTLYFRSASDFAWYLNGQYSSSQDAPGSGGSLSMVLDASGDLTINGALAIDNANHNNGQVNPGLTFGNANGEGIASKRSAGGNQFGLDFYTDSNARMSITNGGNVGIGTTSPATALDVYGGISVENSIFYLRSPGDSYHHIRYGIVGGLGDADGLIFNSNFVVAQGPDGSETPRLVVQGSGNVGIGTTTPGSALDVRGNIATNSVFGFSTVQQASSPYGVYISAPTSEAMGLFTNGVQRVAITSTGNVGIGTTSPTTPLEVQGNFHVNGTITATGSKSGYIVDRFLSRAKKQFDQGDVVVLHTKPTVLFYGVENRIPLVEVTLAAKAGDTRVCGIIDEPVLTPDQTPDLDRQAIGTGTVGLMVTLGAYAYCKVDANIAPIAAGDLLTTSDTRGHAQRYDPKLSAAGCIIGKALAPLEEGRGKIPILMSHQ